MMKLSWPKSVLGNTNTFKREPLERIVHNSKRIGDNEIWGSIRVQKLDVLMSISRQCQQIPVSLIKVIRFGGHTSPCSLSS